MGINYSIDAEARIVRLEYLGEASIEEFEATMKAIFRSPAYEPGFAFLCDRRGGDVATPDYVRRIVAFAQLHKAQVAGSRWATVVSSTVNYGLGRMAGMLVENKDLPLQIEVFTDFETAEAWLLTPDRGRP